MCIFLVEVGVLGSFFFFTYVVIFVNCEKSIIDVLVLFLLHLVLFCSEVSGSIFSIFIALRIFY